MATWNGEVTRASDSKPLRRKGPKKEHNPPFRSIAQTWRGLGGSKSHLKAFFLSTVKYEVSRGSGANNVVSENVGYGTTLPPYPWSI